MDIKKTTTFNTIKKISLIFSGAIALILLCFVYLNIQNSHREREDKLLIDLFGKQRMYTQMISKDANRVYERMQSMIYAGTYSGLNSDNQILKLKENLKVTKDNFAATLTSMQGGEIMVGNFVISIDDKTVHHSERLKKLAALWEQFSASIDILIASEQIDTRMTAATAYINDNNIMLLNACNDLQNEILDASLRSDQSSAGVAYVLMGLMFIVIVMSYIQMQRNLLTPYSQLFKGITEIGLDVYPGTGKLPARKKVISMVTEVNSMFKKINNFISLIENINNNDSFMDTLGFINNTFSGFIPYNYIGIALIDEKQDTLKASYGVSDDTIEGLPEQIMGSTWRIKETSLGELIKTGEGRIINDLEAYCIGKPMKPYNKVILNAGIKSSISLPLTLSGHPVGVIFFSSSKKNVYKPEHLRYLKTLANSIAISLNQNILVNDIIYSSVLALAKLAETRDEDTGEHLERMALYTRRIAELLHENGHYTDILNIEYIEQLEHFSPLHDIGKVGISDGILLKPGRLTAEEFNEMKKHTTFGANVLRSSEQNMRKKGKTMFQIGIEIAENHHEKWDGSGYPRGRKGDEIPLSARIVAVADVFDALTSKRPYKEALPLEAAYEIITEGRGKHFDPVIVDTFMENKSQIELIYYTAKTVQKVS